MIELKIFNFSLFSLGGLHISWPKRAEPLTNNGPPVDRVVQQGRLEVNWYFQLADGTRIPVQNEKILARLERSMAARIAKPSG